MQAEQALQAETASANYAENQQKQAQATANVVVAGVQSQANKNFWYAYALWQAKVVQALARRRAEALARKRAEAEARARQVQQQPTPPKSSSPLAKLVKIGLFIIALGGVGLAGGSVQVVKSPMSVATEMVNNVLNPPDKFEGLNFCGVMAIICPVGGGGVSGGGGGGGIGELILLAFAAILTVDASSDTQVLPNPQIGPIPYNPDDEYLDQIPLESIQWIEFLNWYIYEYRLTGFQSKVGTLAEHLAKLLEREVAGHPPSYPNPENEPDRSWCNTIRRIIQEIDNAGYSPRQLERDIINSGIGTDNWNEIIEAVRDVIELGFCDDHWGDFNGGSLATG